MGAKTTTMAVDMIACAGHGICAELLGEWIALDDWGYPIVRKGGHPTGADDPGQVGGGQLPGPRPQAPEAEGFTAWPRGGEIDGRLQAPHPPAAALGPQRGTSWPKGVGDRYSRSVAVSRRTVSGPTGKRSGVLELTTRPEAPAALIEARNSVAAPPSKISLPMVVSQGGGSWPHVV